MIDYETITVKRVAEPEEASAMIGDTVPWREPTFRGAYVARDADTGELVAAHLPLSGAADLRRAGRHAGNPVSAQPPGLHAGGNDHG